MTHVEYIRLLGSSSRVLPRKSQQFGSLPTLGESVWSTWHMGPTTSCILTALANSGGTSDAQWVPPQHLFQPFAAGMALVHGDSTRAPSGTLDHGPAINCGRLRTCVLKRMVHWMAQEVNASSPGSQPTRSGWNHNAGGSQATNSYCQDMPQNKDKQTTLCGVLHEEIKERMETQKKRNTNYFSSSDPHHGKYIDIY